MKILKTVALAFGVLVVLIGQSFCQTNLQFTSINVTDEGAIQFHWTSQSNEIYEIDEADTLINTNTGIITWNKLYDEYPSQGTNTFIGDFGNYNLAPQILHPKYMSMRFYRILDEGPDSLTDEPTVTIDSLTNNTLASGELTFTVTAATDQPGLHGTILYVDGQEMQDADSTTNYTIGSTNYETDTYSINTCEWLNRTHILFATTEATSQFSSQENGGAVLTGHGVSPFVSVLFNNLVEGISFSEPSFDPSSGQTQQVSAVFPLNSDWTLNIVDVYSNVVQTASGSGTSMLYNWDGTSNGTNIPSGLYYYYITAQTNGEADDEMMSRGRFSNLSSATEINDSPELWAMSPDGSDIPLPLAIYPPNLDTNGLTIFSATPSEINATRASIRDASFSSMDSSGSFSPDDISNPSYVTPLPNPQPSPPSPQRPPNNPVRGLVGTIGVAADTYTANGTTNGPSVGPLDNGYNVGLYIYMQGSTSARTNPPRPEHKDEVKTFVKTMQFYGWSNPVNEIDDQLNINDLRGSGSKFNSVNMAIFLGHGTYGTSADNASGANGCKQMYYSVTSGTSAQYLRLSEMNMGGAGANSLKWMVLDQCFSLFHSNWSNMQNLGVKPYNSNMHLILGANTETWTSSRKWWNFAKYMNYGSSTNYSPLTIRNAYYQGNYDAFHGISSLPPNTVITLAVAGDSACMNDSLQTTNTPSGSWSYDSKEVYPLLQ